MAEKTNEKNQRTQEIDRDFRSYSCDQEQVAAMQKVRDKARELAHLINFECPKDDESERALERLQEVVFWANASIARPK